MKTTNELSITVARDFSDAVGARDKSDGKFSGQEFYEKLLKKRITEAIEKKKKVFIDFDNTWGYPSSFLSGVFGRASRDFGKNVLDYIEVKSDTDKSLFEQIKDATEYAYDPD